MVLQGLQRKFVLKKYPTPLTRLYSVLLPNQPLTPRDPPAVIPAPQKNQLRERRRIGDNEG
ncbi:hypothetical protein NQZ68_025754 [Dissostichus eleginoides]|nr:hypothetical protein NQZ68_025754 [Dissostichus eleginoides]